MRAPGKHGEREELSSKAKGLEGGGIYRPGPTQPADPTLPIVCGIGVRPNPRSRPLGSRDIVGMLSGEPRDLSHARKRGSGATRSCGQNRQAKKNQNNNNPKAFICKRKRVHQNTQFNEKQPAGRIILSWIIHICPNVGCPHWKSCASLSLPLWFTMMEKRTITTVPIFCFDKRCPPI